MVKTRLNTPIPTTKAVRHVVTDGAGCYPWREAFAWRPITTVSGQRVWFKKLYKRRVWICLWSSPAAAFAASAPYVKERVQYATAFDLLTHKD